jgi:flavin reductase (DIM6/NTAB) family NADH-FMN oxidoreductase RutF
MKKSIGAKTIVFPAPVFIVGTYDKAGKPNVCAAAWGGICCSQPPCVSVSLREETYSFGNILRRKAFTVNIPSEQYIKQADYCGIVSGKSEDKFRATGLTPAKSSLVDAPYIEEFPMALECALLDSVKVGLHTIFIGEIKDVKVEERFLDRSGTPEIEKIRPFSFNPATRTYYATGKLLAQAFTVGKK